MINKLIGNIMASPKIKNPVELKGKVIGVTSPSGSSMAFIAQPENKSAVLKSVAKGLRLAKVEQAVEGYESLPMLYDKRIYPRVDGIRNVIRLLGATNEKIRRLKAEDLVDERFVRKLEKEGRF